MPTAEYTMNVDGVGVRTSHDADIREDPPIQGMLLTERY